MTIEGKIIFISGETTVGQKELPKISFVIEENSDREFKNSLMIDLLGDKTEMIKAFKEGDSVKVFLNYRAREYDGRWFNSIGAWKIESLGSSAPASNDDDLPF
jgi:hypothetical protein